MANPEPREWPSSANGKTIPTPKPDGSPSLSQSNADTRARPQPRGPPSPANSSPQPDGSPGPSNGGTPSSPQPGSSKGPANSSPQPDGTPGPSKSSTPVEYPVPENGYGANPSKPLSADQLMPVLLKIQRNQEQIIAEQKALRKSMKYLYSVVKPESVPSSTSCTTTRQRTQPSSSSSTPRRPAPTVTPVYVESPDAETRTFLLGGMEGLVRDISEYHADVRKVSSRAANKPEAMGRLLCSILMRKEFSIEDLATKNVTGKSRDPQTKKSLEMPKLDDSIMKAIFRQAKLQFPDFKDNYTDVKCQTVQLLNDTCKHIRRKSLPVHVPTQD